ncbi:MULTISPECIES: hypothetical protein [Microvirga]|uniref:hypothetical protein n=1 Tax=Microvirga TaxID=186650 RepID=UPI001B369670|nr:MULTISPECIES: hypothetical protein [unclassified Microvirga]MBQ0819157.1 hypothetical protein [Microvirga sp. HBU67558]
MKPGRVNPRHILRVCSIMEAADKLMVLQEGKISQFGPRTSVVSAITPGEKPMAAMKGSA